MDMIYHVEPDEKSHVEEIINNDPIYKLSVTWQKCSALDKDRKGYFLLLSGTEALCDKAQKALADVANELGGDEKKDVIADIKEREEKSMQGFGSIFG